MWVTPKWMKKSRGSRAEMLCKKVILRKIAKFSGKHLHCSLVLSELQIWGVFMWFLRYFQEHLFYKKLINGWFWKPCLFELNWRIYPILIWWRQSKIQNNTLNNILPHRIGNDLCSENTKFYDDRVFCFPVGGFSVF